MSRSPLAMLFSISGLELTDVEKHLLAQANPVGVTLFGRNIHDRTQLKSLINSIKETIGNDDVLIAIDQEGGRVRRLAEPEWPAYAANITLGELPIEQARRAAKLQAQLIAADLNELGINLNFAPVLDLIYPNTSAVIKSRAFSSSELVVADLGRIMVNEYMTHSICPCIKHMPGHGRAEVDPHLQLPRITAPLADLERDFYPFQQLHQTPAGMSAHIIISAVDDQHPLTQSPQGIQTIIRKHIGFDGFLFTDAIDMHALQGTITQKALSSLEAGCDCVCYALGDTAELEALSTVVPPLNECSLDRLERIKEIIKQPKKTPPTAHDYKEYQELLGNIETYHDDYDATEVLNKLKYKGEK